MQIDWYKCVGDVWCNLFRLDLDHRYLDDIEGVYILWSGINPKMPLAVGYGNIRDELKQLKSDIAIRAFEGQGLFVTWAMVPEKKRKPVISFLISHLKPKIVAKGGAIDKKQEVNLPF